MDALPSGDPGNCRSCASTATAWLAIQSCMTRNSSESRSGLQHRLLKLLEPCRRRLVMVMPVRHSGVDFRFVLISLTFLLMVSPSYDDR